MKATQLFANDILDPQLEAHYAYFKLDNETIGLHYHDFFEFVLILSGSAWHLINGDRLKLKEGQLLFIRPKDVHTYEMIQDETCSLINFACTDSMINSLFKYLGHLFPRETFTDVEDAPIVQLSKIDKELLLRRFEEINIISLSDISAKNADLRTLAIELFTKYLLPKQTYIDSTTPFWLTELCSQLQNQENLCRGNEIFTELSGKTYSHVGRSMRKYLKQSPTEYLNRLRIDFAANLLRNTDWSVLNISLESGFQNLSHFNHLFKTYIGMTPLLFRKESLKRAF
ncbi:MAG: AraC family transcriptional regulator [Bacillota bacterium]